MAEFEEAAIKHAEATVRGDYKAANRCHAVIAKTLLFLKEQNEIQQISYFLNHNSIGVHGWAATYLLPVEEQKQSKHWNRLQKEVEDILLLQRQP